MALILIRGLLDKLTKEKQGEYAREVTKVTLMLSIGPMTGEVEHHTIEERMTELLMRVS